MGRSAARAWAGGELKGATFARVARVAASVGVPVLPVKGVLTSRLLYGQSSERPMVDVDIRVRPRDLARLCAAAERDGWTLLERWRAYACAAFDVQGERVELETTVGPPGYCRLRIDAMLRRASQHVHPFGVPHLQPEIHDHALVLVVNAFKDRLARASEHGLEDLARLSTLPEFSFDTLADRANEGGVAGMTWLVADWMVQRRGETAWSELLRRLDGEAPGVLYRTAFRAIDEGARQGRFVTPASRLLVRAGSDSGLMKARSLATMAAWGLELLVVAPAMASARVARG